MNIQQPTNGRNPSNNLSCPHCHTQLPLYAVFCSSCGERVKKIGDWEIRTEDGEDNAQEQDVDTVRIALLSQTQLKRWQSSRSLKNTIAPEQIHINSPLPQDAGAPMSSLLNTEIPRTDLADARAQREATILIEPSQSLPTTPAPSIPETWQRIPETEIPTTKPSGSNRLWPIIIILSAVAAGLVNFVFTGTAIRPLIVFWFLVICPGMVLVRFLRLKEPVVEWTLALALSFAIDAVVAGIQLYAGKWSPTGTLSILIGFSLGGAIVQLAPMGSTTTYISKLSYIVRSRILGVLSAISLAWVKGFWEAQWSPGRLPSLMSRSARSATLRRPDVSKPESSVAQPATIAVLSHQSQAPARKLGSRWPLAWKHIIEKPATVSAPKRWRAPRAWKPGIALIFLALLIGLGVVAGFWSHAPNHSAPPIPTVTAPQSRPTPAPTPVPTIYPTLSGTYIGTIYDIPLNVRANLFLTDVHQSQGKISGYLTVGPGLLGSGPFSGTIDAAKQLQFTVKDADGNPTLFFEGAMQSATSLSGDYYQCLPGPPQRGQCSKAPGSYGIWNVQLG